MEKEKIYAYLDWNVFDKIQKLNELPVAEKAIYSPIENSIVKANIIVPYSNAHLEDLKRGYVKSIEFIDGDLNTLSRLTNNLCIVQYWGSKETVLETRDACEFFYSMVDDSISLKETFSALIEDMPPTVQSIFNIYKLFPVPDNLIEAQEKSPIVANMFSGITPNSNYFDLIENFYSYMYNLHSDNKVYKNLKKTLSEGLKLIKDKSIDLSKFNGSQDLTPGSQVIDKVFQKPFENSKSNANDEYSLVMQTYAKYNFKGHNSDDKFNNMVDDSLHTFYGGHCHYFISNDKKCRYKAIKTYEELEITTNVLGPAEFAIKLSSLDK
jgi:hypothetical protein